MAIVAATTPTLKEVFVVHQTGQDEGPPILGGSCTSDLEVLMNGQVVGGYGNILNKSNCKLDLGHQIRVSGEKSPLLSSTLEMLKILWCQPQLPRPPQLLKEMVLKEWVSWTIQCVVWQNSLQ
jgi:hypothetical protein